MKKNIGLADTIIRVILGIALLFFFLLDGGMKYMSLVGVALLLTAVIRFCPLYSLFGIHTNRTEG